jgi:hypothetical protein
MEKINRLLHWLDSERAVNWLQDLTGTQVTLRDLLDLCNAKRCVAYMNVADIRGYSIDADQNHEVFGSGIQSIINPAVLIHIGTHQTVDLVIEGPVLLSSQSRREEEGLWTVWEATLSLYERTILFRTTDIQALADSMNGVEEQTRDVQILRDQLEQERAARQLAESEASKLRQRQGTTTLANIRDLLYEDKEYLSFKARAEAAERMVESMDKQIREQSEKMRRDGELFEKMAAKLRGAPDTSRQTLQSPKGLTFPYATKHFEAMRDAAEQFWQNHDRFAPAPYGIQKKIQKFLAEQLGTNDRKIAELAAAIKPDELPKS